MTFIQILIWVHAGLGGIALLSGVGALIFKKGSKNHVGSGLVFYYAMASSAAMALVISKWPDHRSNFLFMLGVFSLYLIIGGKRAISFKKITEATSLRFEVILAISMITAAVYTMTNILFNGGPLVLTGIFGAIGSALAVMDLTRWKDRSILKRDWLQIHLGKMMGGYIASTTAFVVVTGLIPNIWGWLTPTILGGIIIAYWNIKLSKKRG